MPWLNTLRYDKDKLFSLSWSLRLELAKFFQIYLVDLLGLSSSSVAPEESRFNAIMQLLLELRYEARRRCDFQTADKIRQKLAKHSIYLKDGKDGFSQWVIGENED